jgi:hypothetical protein
MRAQQIARARQDLDGVLDAVTREVADLSLSSRQQELGRERVPTPKIELLPGETFRDPPDYDELEEE